MRFALCCFVLLNAASAQGVEAELQTDEFIWAALSGAGVGGAASVVGGLLGNTLDEPCPDDKLPNECPPPAFTAAGAYTGLVLGTAYGVKLYAESKGYEGRYSGALYGAMLGNLASGIPALLIISATDDPMVGFPVLAAVLIAFPAVGATIGYEMTLPDEAPPAMALLDLHPDYGLRVGVPPVSLGPDGHGGLTGYAPLLSSTF